MRLKFNEKDLAIVAINLFEDWHPRNAKKQMDRFLTSTRPELSLVLGDKVIMEHFGGMDRSGCEAFTFLQLRGPKRYTPEISN